jgi:hypothetical protein
VTRYQLVHWLHEFADEPGRLYSEVDDDGWEIRKVDEYRCGRRDIASNGIASV